MTPMDVVMRIAIGVPLAIVMLAAAAGVMYAVVGTLILVGIAVNWITGGALDCDDDLILLGFGTVLVLFVLGGSGYLIGDRILAGPVEVSAEAE